MNTADILGALSAEEAQRLGAEVLGPDERVPLGALRSTIEGVLRSLRYIQELLVNR